MPRQAHPGREAVVKALRDLASEIEAGDSKLLHFDLSHGSVPDASLDATERGHGLMQPIESFTGLVAVNLKLDRVPWELAATEEP